MTDPIPPGARARSFFDAIWKDGDYWSFESSPFEAAKHARQLDLVRDRRYDRALEIGCGAGAFTRLLAQSCRNIVGLDVSAAAIERARARGTADGAIDFRVTNAMEYDPAPDGPFDLVVISETIYYLGWLYTLFEVAWFVATVFDATRDEGRLLMTNTHGTGEDRLHTRWLLGAYRDLLRNVGYRLDVEEPFSGEKDGVAIEATTYLFTKPAGAGKVAV
jgi:SAM-dependent methyltransferase